MDRLGGGSLVPMVTRLVEDNKLSRAEIEKFASGVASGRNSISLQRRLRMLVKGSSAEPTPRRIRAAAAATVVVLLVYCGTDLPTTPAVPEEAPTPPPADTVVVTMGPLPWVTARGPGSPDSLATAPREPEEPPGPLPADTMLIVVLPDGRDSLATEQLGGDPEYAYWRLLSSDMDRPQPLADAPVQPVACRLDPVQPDEEARDEAMAACAAAMSKGLREAGISDDGYVCVQWGNSARWRGFCASHVPTERFHLHGNGTGSVLLEKIAVFGSEG